MANLSLKGINKVYPNGFHAVVDFNLEINDGEFIVLVGASGCGKSTTLRMIAGLEEISSGSLEIGNKVVTHQPPKNRDIAMVFQNYALYPQMTIYQNMAFSLMLRKEHPDEIHKKVMKAAELLGLLHQLNKKPKQLSGGQRQRVAVGRAIVRSPQVFLFDEPLSNLDAKLRGQMRYELKLLHQSLKATMIYVTHDQIEALTLADRIVVMDKGVVQQVGTPIELYEKPANLHVAGFIGLPPMNFFEGKMISEDTVKTEQFELKLDQEIANDLAEAVGKDIVVGIRPENAHEGGDIEFEVSINENLGQYTLVHGTIRGKKAVFKLTGWHTYQPGQKIMIGLDMGKVHFFDKQTTKALR